MRRWSPLPSLAIAILVIVQGMVWSGCARSEAVVQEGAEWSEGALRDHLRQLTAPIAPADSVRAARRTLYAARQMGAAGLMPARDPSFLVAAGASSVTRVPLADPARAHVLGYVVGRHPSYYDELVLVVADMDSPGAAAVLEAARALAEKAVDTQVPERTVLFALWAPPRTGILGLRDFIANPTWELGGIEHALLVTMDTSAVAESQRLLEVQGITSEVVAVTDQSVAAQPTVPEVEQARTLVRTVSLTELLYTRLLSVATVENSPEEDAQTER